MKNEITKKQGGFTLIELMIVVVIIGILAALAIPPYATLTREAKANELKVGLSSLRSGISMHYANTAVRTGFASWPTMADLLEPDKVIPSIPVNPYQDPKNAPDSVVTGITKGCIVGTRGGWAYKPATGEIWPNTISSGINENKF